MLEKNVLFFFPMLPSLWTIFLPVHKLSEDKKLLHKFKLKRGLKSTLTLSFSFPFILIKSFYIFWFRKRETFISSSLPDIWNEQFLTALSGTIKRKFVSSVMSNLKGVVAVLERSSVLSFSD